MVQALNTVPIVKKRTKVFRRLHYDRYKRLSRTGWRKPRGIDSAQRRRFSGWPLQPTIGYGSNKKTKGMMPNGLRPFLINNVKDLEILMMQNRKYSAVVAHAVSSKKRKAIVERAAQLNVKLVNGAAKLKSQE
eukprot:c15816_g1_i2.p1 GENE.c15816_g1_i2~~c15816_g1_i2.p1  ORF type:complete len:133 (+),score=1.07 c15816_g1_i2:41-439(+)